MVIHQLHPRLGRLHSRPTREVDSDLLRLEASEGGRLVTEGTGPTQRTFGLFYFQNPTNRWKWTVLLMCILQFQRGCSPCTGRFIRSQVFFGHVCHGGVENSPRAQDVLYQTSSCTVSLASFRRNTQTQIVASFIA